jgi:hypothetical protein
MDDGKIRVQFPAQAEILLSLQHPYQLQDPSSYLKDIRSSPSIGKATIS